MHMARSPEAPARSLPQHTVCKSAVRAWCAWVHAAGEYRYYCRISDGVSEGNAQHVSPLIFPQTVEGVDVRPLEHGLDACQADALIAKFPGNCHECGEAVGMAVWTPILKEVQYLEALL